MKTLKNYILFITSLVVIISCSDDPAEFTIGEEFIESQTHLTLIDTFSVNFSTSIIDSVVTSGSGQMLIGNYEDENIGLVNSKSYFQLGAPDSYSLDENEIYDSTSIILYYSNYYFGDTTQAFTFTIHRLTEHITYSYDTYILSTQEFSYDESPIGEVTFLPRPNTSDSITIKIDNEIGQSFFDLIMENSDLLDDDDDFINYFNGLVLVPSENNQCIVGFDVDAKLNLYSHYNDISTVENIVELNINSTTKQFNNIVHNFSGTPLENLSNQNSNIKSTETSGLAYIQGGIGLVINISFPYLSDILLFDRGTIMEANLTVAPLLNSYKNLNLPTSFYIYQTSNIHSILDDEDYVSYSTMNYDQLYQEENYYTFDLTDFFNSELSDNYLSDDNTLIITLPLSQVEDSFERLILDTESNKTKLNIYYLSY